MVRPWKVFSLLAGVAGLIVCAIVLKLPDWDIGISIMMAMLTYLTAPWAVGTVVDAIRYRSGPWPLRILVALALAIAVADGSYLLYSTIMEHPTFRTENFVISLTLYSAAGLLWMQEGTLREVMVRCREWLRFNPGSDL